MTELAGAHELEDAVREDVAAHCATGDAFAQAGRLEEALSAYNTAWKRLPEPQYRWEAATAILTTIGELALAAGRPLAARKAFEYAMSCPGGSGDPHLHLRFGQVLFDAGELDRAGDELMRAYRGGGEEVFGRDDPKYREFLRARSGV